MSVDRLAAVLTLPEGEEEEGRREIPTAKIPKIRFRIRSNMLILLLLKLMLYYLLMVAPLYYQKLGNGVLVPIYNLSSDLYLQLLRILINHEIHIMLNSGFEEELAFEKIRNALHLNLD